MSTSKNRGRTARIEGAKRSATLGSDGAGVGGDSPSDAGNCVHGAAAAGRPAQGSERDLRSGYEWRILPVHSPPWRTVYWWFWRFVCLRLFRAIRDAGPMIDRARAGRAMPTAAVLNSQTIRTLAPGGSRGFGGAKKIIGRKRHIAAGTDGRLLEISQTAPARRPSWTFCASVGHESGICSPMRPMIASKCWTRRPSSTSSSRSPPRGNGLHRPAQALRTFGWLPPISPPRPRPGGSPQCLRDYDLRWNGQLHSPQKLPPRASKRTSSSSRSVGVNL